MSHRSPAPGLPHSPLSLFSTKWPFYTDFRPLLASVYKMLLQVTDSGELILPAELVQAPPRTKVEAERHGDAVVVKPTPPAPLHSAAFQFPSLPGHLVDETMTFRRED